MTDVSGSGQSRTKIHAIVGMLTGWIVGKGADDTVVASLGYWGAFLVGLVTAGVVGGGTYWLLNTLRAQRPQ